MRILSNQIEQSRTLMDKKESPAQATEWAKNQEWRKTYSWDFDQALALRLALVKLGLGLDWRMEGQEFEVMEANQRQAIVDMVPELSREDLAAVYNLVRLLVVIPDDD